MTDTEIKQVIQIDTGPAITNLKEYKAHIEELKGKLLGLEKGSQEYNSTVQMITNYQGKLNEVMTDSKNGIDATTNSYNALSQQMSKLKKEWKNMEIGTEEWKKTAEQINDLNDKLKEADADVGVYSRNVGNYAGGFLDAFSKIGDSAKALNNPLKVAGTAVKTFGASLKTLAMNPIGAVIMAIVVAVKALKKGFEGSEEASNKLKSAFSAFQPVVNAISNAFTGFANIVGTIAQKAVPALIGAIQKAGEWMMKLLNKVGIVSDEKMKAFQESIEAQKEEMKVTQELTDREIELTKKKRESQVKEAKLELEISQLRAKAADKEKYTNEERAKYLDQAIAKERALNKTKLDIAQEEFDILNERAKLTDNDAATNDALAAAEANLYRVKKEYFDKEKELTAQKNEAKNAQNAADKAAATEEKNAQKEAEKAAKDAYEALKNSIENRIKLTESYLGVVEKGSDEEVRLLKEKEDLSYQLSIETAKYKIKDEKELNATLEGLRRAHLNNIEKIEDDAAQKRIDSQNKANANTVKETEMEFGGNSMEAYDARISAYQYYLDTLQQKQDESNEDFKARQLAAEEQLNAEIAAKLNQRISNYSSLAGSIGSIFGSIADIYEEDINKQVEDGAITEEQAEKRFQAVKAFQIGQATIEMLTGIVAAVSGLFTTKSGPWDIALAAVQATSIAAAGIANIAKIKNTQFGSSSSSAGATASVAATPTTVDYNPTYTTSVTGLNEQESLNNSLANTMAQTPIYVSVSEINDVQNKVKVRENEATF